METEEVKSESVEVVAPNINDSKYQSYMLMFNISKQKNFGTLLRSAAAFNVNAAFVIDGNPKKKKLSTFGS